MSMQRSIRTSLAGTIAFALFGITSIAAAQALPQPQTTQQVPPPPPPPPPPTLQQPAMPPPAATQMPPPPPQPPMTPTPPATPMPPPTQQQPMPATQPQGGSGQFYQGTKSTATYPVQNGTLTVNAGMPANVKDYGPPPSFKSLDRDQNGHISQDEAQAYPPLDSDFLYASGESKSISRAQYEKWVQTQQ